MLHAGHLATFRTEFSQSAVPHCVPVHVSLLSSEQAKLSVTLRLTLVVDGREW